MENFRLCRICITTESPVMMSIFGEDALWEKIISFANINIKEGDSLPQEICSICAKSVINFYTFKEKCENADNFFRQQLIKKNKKLQHHQPPTSAEDHISLSSSSDNEDVNLVHDNIKNQINFPILIEDSIGRPPKNDYDQNIGTTITTLWSPPQSPATSTIDEKIFDLMPLIPEIEIYTPTQPASEDDDSDDGDDDNDKFSDQQESHQCNVCYQLFPMESLLKNHMNLSHTNLEQKHIRLGNCIKKRKSSQKPIECPECKTSFPSGHHLGWHKRTGLCQGATLKPILNIQKILKNQQNANTGNQFNKKVRKNQGRGRPSKRRSRIKLDSYKIALAKRLVEQRVTTTKLSQELNISRTFAWRLRKSLACVVNNNNNAGQDKKPKYLNQRKQQNVPEKSLTNKKLPPNILQNKNLPHLSIEVNVIDEFPKPGCSQNSNSNINIIPHKSMPMKKSIQIKPSKRKLIKQEKKEYRKPRKPNVFLDNDKYEKAKILVENHASTMEVAQQLNISQMSAWKLRRCILKGIPLTFRKSTISQQQNRRAQQQEPEQQQQSVQQESQQQNSKRERQQGNSRLKGEAKLLRDRQIQEEILSILKENHSIQYWKVSENLAKKGFKLSPSSVCQKLKSMGYHRRWKAPNGSSFKDQAKFKDQNMKNN